MTCDWARVAGKSRVQRLLTKEAGGDEDALDAVTQRWFASVAPLPVTLC